MQALGLRALADRVEHGEAIPAGVADLFAVSNVSSWLSTKARRVLAASLRMGWRVKKQVGISHRVLERDGWADVTFAFHDGEEIGPRMLARIAKPTGLRPEDL